MNSKKQTFKLAITALLLVILICTPFLVKTISYINAVKFFKEEKYENAITEFERLGEYKDSSKYLFESKYLLANEYMEEEEYFKAIDILEPLAEESTGENSVEIKHRLAQCYLYEGTYTSAEELLEQIKNDVDVSNEQKEVQYLKAIDLYENGKYDEGIEIFEKIGMDYKEVSDYIKKCQKDRFLGKWIIADEKLYETKHDFETVGLNINEDKVIYLDKTGMEEGVYGYEISFNYDVVDGELWPVNKHGELVESIFTITYVSNDCICFEDKILEGQEERLILKRGEISIDPKYMKPQIGMTVKELLDSKWGFPKDINKTITTYGVHEQWCYSGDRYVYLDDGIVTGIQE